MSINELRDLLRETDQQLEASTGAVEHHSAEWFNRQALLAMRAQLSHELAVASGDHQVELALVGGAERDHTVQAAFLSAVVENFQVAVNHLMQVRMHGTPKSKGAFRTDVRSAGGLRVAAPMPGSFVVALDGPQSARPLELPDLWDREDELGDPREMWDPLDASISLLLDVLDAASPASERFEVLGEIVASLGSGGAVDRLASLVRALSRTGTSVRVVHRPPDEPPREVVLRPLDAVELQNRLQRSRTVTDEVTAHGQLTGVVWSAAGRFRLEVEDDPDLPSTIRGLIVTSLRGAAREAFDRTVRATLERTVTTLGGQSKTSWRLVGLEILDS